MINHWTDRKIVKSVIEKFTKKLSELSAVDANTVKAILDVDFETYPFTETELSQLRGITDEELMDEVNSVYEELIDQFDALRQAV